MLRRHIALLTLLIAVCAAPLRGADEAPRMTAQLSAEEIYEGESVEYQVGIMNAQASGAPDLSALDADFNVSQAGDAVSVHIDNGRQSVVHLYNYRLTPKRSGMLTLPGPAASVAGRKLVGPEATLRVLAPEKQDIVLAEIKISRTPVYPTQPFDVTLRILVRPLPNDARRDPVAVLPDPPGIEINWLQPSDGLRTQDYGEWLQSFITNTERGFTLNELPLSNRTGFLFGRRYAVFNLYKGRETRRGAAGENIEYCVYELTRTFTPDQAGSYPFGPALIKGTFVNALSGRRYTGRKLIVPAAAQTVTVKQVPAPRPANFCGGIGACGVQASAAPVNARVGDPITLTLQFTRQPASGSLSLISAPNLQANAQLAADFDIIDSKPTGEVSGETKKFSYGLRPKRAGVSIPPITVSLFNPEKEKFDETATEPVALHVTDVARLNNTDLIGTVAVTPNTEIRTHQQGVFQDITDVSSLQDQRPPILKHILAALGAWAAYGLLHILVTRHRRRACDGVWQRRQRAKRDALNHMQTARTAMSAGQPLEVLRAARTGITSLIGNMLNLPETGMTAHDARQALGQTRLPAETRDKAVCLLETLEALEYSSASQTGLSGVLAGAEALIPELHRGLDNHT